MSETHDVNITIKQEGGEEKPSKPPVAPWVKWIPLIVAVIAAVAPITTAISGYASLSIEAERTKATIAKTRSEIRVPLLELATGSDTPDTQRGAILRLLTTHEDAWLSAWANEELDRPEQRAEELSSELDRAKAELDEAKSAGDADAIAAADAAVARLSHDALSAQVRADAYQQRPVLDAKAGTYRVRVDYPDGKARWGARYPLKTGDNELAVWKTGDKEDAKCEVVLEGEGVREVLDIGKMDAGDRQGPVEVVKVEEADDEWRYTLRIDGGGLTRERRPE